MRKTRCIETASLIVIQQIILTTETVVISKLLGFFFLSLSFLWNGSLARGALSLEALLARCARLTRSPPAVRVLRRDVGSGELRVWTGGGSDGRRWVPPVGPASRVREPGSACRVGAVHAKLTPTSCVRPNRSVLRGTGPAGAERGSPAPANSAPTRGAGGSRRLGRCCPSALLRRESSAVHTAASRPPVRP